MRWLDCSLQVNMQEQTLVVKAFQYLSRKDVTRMIIWKFNHIKFRPKPKLFLFNSLGQHT